MANEVSVTLGIEWNAGTDRIKIGGINPEKYTQIGTIAMENVQTIGTASEAIFLGDITDPAWLMFKNIGVNIINISLINPAVAATSTITLGPGKSTLVIGIATAYYAIATTAATNLVVIAIQR